MDAEISVEERRREELKACLERSADFVDKSAMDDYKNAKPVDEFELAEEETPTEWQVDTRYVTRLLRRVNEMRAKKRLCDLTIGLSDGKLQAHKTVLASGSPFFKRLTESTNAAVLNFYHINCRVADILFDFLYTGEVSLDKVDSLRRSDRLLLLEKAKLFEVDESLRWLWRRLGLKSDETGQTEQTGRDEIVRRRALYMNEKRKESIFTDWKIRICAVDLPVSKVFMAAASNYFNDFFSRNPSEAQAETYTLSELDRTVFRKTLNFIYTGHATLADKTMQQMQQLLHQANYLGIRELRELLTAELERRTDETNCFELLDFANATNNRQLSRSLHGYIGSIANRINKSEGFLGLKFQNLKDLLLSRDLKFLDSSRTCLIAASDFESKTLQLLLDWIRRDRIRRSSHAKEIFDLVKQLTQAPFTGKAELAHRMVNAELNNVMGAYYKKLARQNSTKSSTKTLSVAEVLKARRFLTPTCLLVSVDFGVVSSKKEEEGEEKEDESSCSRLSPSEWLLTSLQIFSNDPDGVEVCGVKTRHSRLNWSGRTDQVSIVTSGIVGDFSMEASLNVEAGERATAVKIARKIAGKIDARIAKIVTNFGRQLPLSTPVESKEKKEEEEEIKVTSPTGCHGYLHGVAVNTRAKVFNLLWSAESGVEVDGNSVWQTVVEDE